MKRFLLQELVIVSRPARAGLRIRFDPTTTILRGTNTTGKSHVVKTILRTFGVETPVSEPWRSLDPRSLVRFTVGDRSFALLRHGIDRRFSLFDSQGRVLGAFFSIMDELAPELAEIFSYPIRVLNRELEAIPLAPAHFFSPLYIDQDLGWTNPWAELQGVNAIADWKQTVLPYFAGLDSVHYFEAYAQQQLAANRRKKIQGQREVLSNVYQSLDRDFAKGGFNPDFDAFEAEIAELLKTCDALREEEEKFKATLNGLRTEQSLARTQLAVLRQAKKELDADLKALKKADGTIGCPLCGAEYENGAADRFPIIADADNCEQVSLELDAALHKLKRQITKESERGETVRAKLLDVERVLAAKVGEVNLREVLAQGSRNELRTIMERSLNEYDSQDGREAVVEQHARRAASSARDAERRKEVGTFFKRTLTDMHSALSLGRPNDSVSLTSSSKEFGSLRPRQVLAYRVAFLQTMSKYGSGASMGPFIVDSPRQQDLDNANYRDILKLLTSACPPDTQLILALFDTDGLVVDGQQYEFVKKEGALSQEVYEPLKNELAPFEEAAATFGRAHLQ